MISLLCLVLVCFRAGEEQTPCRALSRALSRAPFAGAVRRDVTVGRSGYYNQLK
jgi:hypothetical protein